MYLVFTILIVFATVLVVVLSKKRSLATFGIIGGLIGFCLGSVVAFVIAAGGMLGFFDFELPPISIPSFGAFTPGLWLPVATVVPGVFGGIILGLLKRRATPGQSVSAADDRP